MAIKIKSDREIELMRESCRLAAEVLERAGELVKPGITTDEINTFVHDLTIKSGAIPSPLNYHGFPKSVCTSVNDVVCHGIPGNQVLKEGDIINIDVTCLLNGYHGDTSRTYAVGAVSKEAKQLMDVTERAMDDGIAAAVPGGYFGDIGDAIQSLVDEFGYGIVREFCGHGIGRGFHEDPHVLHYRSRSRGDRIRVVEHHLIALEMLGLFPGQRAHPIDARVELELADAGQTLQHRNMAFEIEGEPRV